MEQLIFMVLTICVLLIIALVAFVSGVISYISSRNKNGKSVSYYQRTTKII
jgi:hypothetical protein